ncbi:rod shape-determining protein MreC [Pelagibacteraceae bacterium]|nr:rod shape-determining protein MreC [Pelagibacteraceae bacterium]
MSTSRDDFGIAFRSALLQKGAKQKFSLIFFVIISIFIIFLDRYPNNFMDKVRNLMNDGIYRVSSITTSPFKFLSYLGETTKVHFVVYKENKTLKEELKKLRQKEFQLQFLSSENKRLQEIIDTTDVRYSDSIIAKVLLDKQSPFLKSVIINRGSSSKIKKGMPVVDGNHLVGRVVEVNFFSSRVLLLNDLNSRIPTTIEPSAVQAIMAGVGEEKPVLKYLPEIYKPVEGQTVFTSGKDGIFSPGIAIGKIFIDDEKVKLKLFSDPNQLSFVNVLLSKGSVGD